MPKILRNYILGYKKVKGKIVFFVEISKFMTSIQKLKGKRKKEIGGTWYTETVKGDRRYEKEMEMAFRPMFYVDGLFRKVACAA